MDMHLDTSTVLITGASGGIGRALATAFADEGARLVLHAHTGGERLRTSSVPDLGCARVVEGDIRNPAEVQACFAAGEDRFGRIDIAIANAGVWPSASQMLHEMSVERITDTISVNLLGATWTARAWMAGLREHGPRADGRGACLLFIGSTAGRFGEA